MKHIIFIILIIFSTITSAQDTILDNYIKFALENNLTIKQNNLSIDEAEKALKIAKGLFMPEIKLQSRYTFAQGGRIIEFPIGDLLNPVYGTLNQLLQMHM